MSMLRFMVSRSLDGDVAGPCQGLENPPGIGGGRLHEFRLAVFRALPGLEGGDINESTPVVEESPANIGATVMAVNVRRSPRALECDDPWKGCWGINPPFHHQVFMLTHSPRSPLELEGGTTFTFVTSGLETALELARRVAGRNDVSLACGTRVAPAVPRRRPRGRDELKVVPTLLGSGERLFDRVGDDLHALELGEPSPRPTSPTSSSRDAEGAGVALPLTRGPATS